MWELDYKESWALKNWCFWTVVLEKTPESPLGLQGDQPWISLGRTDVEAEDPYFGHLMRRADSLEKTLILWRLNEGKDKGTTEDEMVR